MLRNQSEITVRGIAVGEVVEGREVLEEHKEDRSWPPGLSGLEGKNSTR
jgi:hypothetical protein